MNPGAKALERERLPRSAATPSLVVRHHDETRFGFRRLRRTTIAPARPSPKRLVHRPEQPPRRREPRSRKDARRRKPTRPNRASPKARLFACRRRKTTPASGASTNRRRTSSFLQPGASAPPGLVNGRGVAEAANGVGDGVPLRDRRREVVVQICGVARSTLKSSASCSNSKPRTPRYCAPSNPGFPLDRPCRWFTGPAARRYPPGKRNSDRDKIWFPVPPRDRGSNNGFCRYGNR